MRHTTILRTAGAALCAAALFACSDRSGPTGPDLGVVGTDPAASAPGIFLGDDMSGDLSVAGSCFDTSQLDSDQDGLVDRCEGTIAMAFAPELAYNSADNTGREEHWAAEPFITSNGTWGVRIAYLLSYYIDLGTVGCRYGLVQCGGHYGDSEALWIDVYYDPATRHWVLDRAEYSAHSGANIYNRGTAAYPPALEYPGTIKGRYPRVYVSRQKHAGYATDRSCDAGNYGLDDCQSNVWKRVTTLDTRSEVGSNLGNGIASAPPSARFQDCVGSAVYPSNGTECYWTDKAFDGWQAKLPSTDSYAGKLKAHYLM